MSLRRQLLLVSLLLLAIPWAGSQFIRETEFALRQGQVRSLEAAARAIAASFSDRLQLIYPQAGRMSEPPAGARSLYAPPAEAPIQLDGYAEGWPSGWSGEFVNDSPTLPLVLRYRAATRGNQLYLLLQVMDKQPVYDNPGISREPNGDRVLLSTWLDARRQEYVISTAAPGKVRGQFAGRRHPGIAAESIQGYWQDTADGYTLELTLPLAITGGRLGILAINVGPGQANPTTAGNMDLLATRAPPWLLYSPTPLRDALRAFAEPGQVLQVLEGSAREVARISAPASGTPASTGRPFWLLRWLYRHLLTTGEYPDPPPVAADGTLAAAEVEQAIQGLVASTWYRDSTGRMVLATAAPVRDSLGQVRASVRISQDSEEYLSLTDQAFGSLLGYSLLAIGLAMLGLLGYASLLSWRIGRLSRAANRVVQRGQINLDAFPRSRVPDEIGDLSRNYAHLLGELYTYNEYLRTLSRKLSHELRTPIAVIQSSLDNLENTPGESAAPYLERARSGLSRLNRILTAMTEASRVEESVRGEMLQPVDLSALLREILPAYSSAWPQRNFVLHCAPERALIQGSSDLLVQALDKLVDNAASFSPEGSSIRLSLKELGESYALEVENQGPLLPEGMQGRLFEAMVSIRESRGNDVHLGLGLYIVKLIVEHMGGQVYAFNRPDQGGVTLRLLLPRKRPV
ncbi:ATP-binding protein [Haliea sp. E17]|uniref:ATP-binding protein n=1 Tax=Haliea sp. E17 TaxID=3401576 RepID=UPI003AAF624F